MAIIEADLLASLEGFSGELLRPGDGGYGEARRIHNGMIDKQPALIARCQGVTDIVAAVNLGHNVAGRAVTDGGAAAG